MKFNNKKIESNILNELKNKYHLSFSWETDSSEDEFIIYFKQNNSLVLTFNFSTLFASMLTDSQNPIGDLENMNDEDSFQQLFIYFTIALLSIDFTERLSLKEKLLNNFNEELIISFVDLVESVYFNTINNSDDK